jgi:glycosyltransferase 2 family protein
MKKRRFNWFLLIRLAGIALFIVVISRTDLAELWDRLKKVDPGHLVIAVFFLLLGLVVKAIRWYILNEKGFDKRRFLKRSGEFFEGYAVGVITPGRVGELMKAGHAGTKTGILGAGLRAIAERGTDLAIFIIIGGIAVAQGTMPGIGDIWGWVILATGIVALALSLLVLSSPVFVRLLEKIMHLTRILKKDIALGFEFRSAANTSGFFALSLMSNLSYFISCYFLATGVSLDLNFIQVSGGVATAGVFNTIPITVMGLGTREVTFLYVFQAFPQAQVIAFSGLVFLTAQIGGGLFSMLLGQALLWKTEDRIDTSD